MKCAEVHLNLGAFVLGGLESEEEAEIRHHLALCSGCRDKLEELERVSQALKAAPPRIDPPNHLKDKILSRVRADELSSSDEELPPADEEPSSSRKPRYRSSHFVLPSVAAATLVAVVALAIFFGSQAEPPVATVQLLPTPELQDELRAEGESYWGVAELRPQPSGNQQVKLKLNNLEEPGQDSFYEMWFVSGQKYISAGSFTTVGLGKTTVWLTAPPETRNYSNLLITEESADNASAPSGDVILRGEVP